MKILLVEEKNKHVLLNLLQAYEAEFSAITKKLPDQNGMFSLDSSWESPNFSYLLYLDNYPCGFAIVSKINQTNDIAEFYVIPSKRGSKVGTMFSHFVFDRHSGPWQVRQIAGANQARKFWRQSIQLYTDGTFSESEVDDPSWGTVTRQSFQGRNTE